MASTGQVDAKGILQPTGLPVIGMTMRPAAFKFCRALKSVWSDGAFGGEGVVNVGEDANYFLAFCDLP
jgi:hypothetical protein